jgi:hypothetical protein
MAEDAPLSYEERQLAMFILGPWVSTMHFSATCYRCLPLQLIGCFLDILLQGILFGQVSQL